jgi:hypothetical protein
MYNYQFYSIDKPVINEIVLVNFTEKKDSYFKGNLLEYNLYDAILNFHDATRKKKIKNWNNIIVLNKSIPAQVEDVDSIKNIVKLSLYNIKNNIYIDYFNENKYMDKIINSYCIINNYLFTDIWYNVIHKLDILRRNTNINISLYNYFISNLDILKNDLLYNNIVIFYETKYINLNKKTITKFGIISNIGIDIIKTIFKNILDNLNNNYILKYDSAPNYIFETDHNNDKIIHDNFINNLNKEITIINDKYNKQVIFLKTY